MLICNKAIFIYIYNLNNVNVNIDNGGFFTFIHYPTAASDTVTLLRLLRYWPHWLTPTS